MRNKLPDHLVIDGQVIDRPDYPRFIGADGGAISTGHMLTAPLGHADQKRPLMLVAVTPRNPLIAGKILCIFTLN